MEREKVGDEREKREIERVEDKRGGVKEMDARGERRREENARSLLLKVQVAMFVLLTGRERGGEG
jgi:hypothetical protein